MGGRLYQLSLRQLRDRFEDGASPSARELEELSRDPRRGARELHARLLRRAEAERAERERLAEMAETERRLWRQGYRRVAGVDEAGMAPLAGPVVAAAAVLPPGTEIDGLDDSKRLSAEARERLAGEIRSRAEVAVGVVTPEEIDRDNIYRAGLLAMRRAATSLSALPEHVLVDARAIPDLPTPQTPCPRGDANHISIAAASIIAKTHRDGLMRALDRDYPGYGFANHKGYPTAEHARALRSLGACPAHRRSFPYVRQLIGAGSPRFDELSWQLSRAETETELEDVSARLAEAKGALTVAEYRKLRALLSRRRAGLREPVC